MSRPMWRAVTERAVAALLFVVASPIVVAVALLSLAYYRSWPFFVHDRVGLEGARLRMVKIRSLPPDTISDADKYALRNVQIPSVMSRIRRLHLDELPQLLHIALGQMAFVGPRPEMPILHESLPPEFAQERTTVLPGLTGLWQISPHCIGLISERPEYDRLYVHHRSPRLDAWIIARTVVKMFTGRTTHIYEIPRGLSAGSPTSPVRASS